MLRAATSLRPSPKIHPDEWATKHRIYPETAGIPGPRDPYLTPYILRFNRVLHSGEDVDSAGITRIYSQAGFVTAAQQGKTDGELDVIGARLDQKPSPILMVGPTKELVEDMFEPRIMELIDQADCLKDKLMRGKKNKKLTKWIAGVKFRLAYGGSSAQLKSDPAGLAIIDEYDEMMANVKGQGSVLGLVDARGGTYADAMVGVSSTPSIGTLETVEQDNIELPDGTMSKLIFWKKGEPDDIQSPIWVFWQSGTMYHWAWPCPHCETFFIPRFDMLKWPGDATPSEARVSTHIDCPHCGAEINDEEHKEWMNERGDYVAPGQTIRLVDDKPLVDGDPPETNRFTCWASGQTSPFVTWGERVEKYLNAKETNDPAEIQTAINAQMGELYAPGMGGEKPDWKQIADAAQPYQFGEIPGGVIRLVAGVDVQKSSLYYVIRGFGGRASSWLLDRGQLFGPTDGDEVWQALTDLLTTPVAGEMYIEKCLIDSGYRPNKVDAGDEHRVYQYCRDMSWLCRATKGRDIQSPPYKSTKLEVTARDQRKKVSLELITLSTDFFKTMVYSRVRTPVEQGGAFYVPMGIDEDYCKQVTSEARTIENSKPVWVQTSKQNHYFDCECLAAAAGYSLNVHRLPAGIVREGFDDPKPDPEPVPEPQSQPEPEVSTTRGAPVADPAPDGASPAPGAGDDMRASIRDRFSKKGRRLHK